MNEGMCAPMAALLFENRCDVCVCAHIHVCTHTPVQMLPLLALHTGVWTKVGICHMVREWALTPIEGYACTHACAGEVKGARERPPKALW